MIIHDIITVPVQRDRGMDRECMSCTTLHWAEKSKELYTDLCPSCCHCVLSMAASTLMSLSARRCRRRCRQIVIVQEHRPDIVHGSRIATERVR